MTAPRKRTPKKMSLDRGYVPTKRQRAIEKAFLKAGGRHPAYIGFIAADSGLGRAGSIAGSPSSAWRAGCT